MLKININNYTHTHIYTYLDLINFLRKKNGLISSIVIITDDNVANLYLVQLIKKIQDNLINIIPIGYYIVPNGEKNKTRDTKNKIEDYLLENKHDKKTCLIALGGGMITDLTGFVAATYLRGISVIYVPTTLLAMIDASIGAKTGVNTPWGKNLIGCYYQPDLIILNTKYLTSLNNEDYLSAFAEIIKHAIIADKKYFDYLINNYNILISRDNTDGYFNILEYVIYKSIEIKNNIVNKDPKETYGIRHRLNFGHTIGHALESASGYNIPHGIAVAAGLIIESLILLNLNILKKNDFDNILKIIKLYKLDLFFKKYLFPKDFNILNIFYSYLYQDKKNIGQEINFVLIRSVGECLEVRKRQSQKYPTKYIQGVEMECIKQSVEFFKKIWISESVPAT